jgi:rhodanese-related sulfurtransferase
MKEQFAPSDTILLYCATGGRAAMAVNALAKAGFTKVYNIVNGLEGDRIDDSGSVFHGKHMRNGWKNSGLPWGYGFHPDLMWVDPTP